MELQYLTPIQQYGVIFAALIMLIVFVSLTTKQEKDRNEFFMKLEKMRADEAKKRDESYQAAIAELSAERKESERGTQSVLTELVKQTRELTRQLTDHDVYTRTNIDNFSQVVFKPPKKPTNNRKE